MEKGFNDSELEDIMSEIESLEDEYSEEEKDIVSKMEVVADENDEDNDTDHPEQSISTGPEGQLGESRENEKHPMNEEIQSSASMPEPGEDSANFKKDDNIVLLEQKDDLSQTKGLAHSKMDFSIVGNMSMQLNFSVAGQVVKLFINEADGLKINMEHGATFTLPMGDLKKVS